jgi:hypothetical protein
MSYVECGKSRVVCGFSRFGLDRWEDAFGKFMRSKATLGKNGG